MEQNEIRISLVGQKVELTKTLSNLIDELGVIQRQIDETKAREESLKNVIDQSIAEHDLSAMDGMIQTLKTKQANLESSQKKLSELEGCNRDLDLQISEQTALLRAEEEEYAQNWQIAIDKVKDWCPKYLSSITFDKDGKSVPLNIQLFHQITSKVIEGHNHISVNDPKNEYGKVNYVIGLWMKNGILTHLFMPLLDAILFGFFKCMKNTAGSDNLRNVFVESYECYNKEPNQHNLLTAIEAALNRIIGIPFQGQLVRFEWNDQITEILPQLVDIYCPVYKDLKQIFFTETSEFNWLDSLKIGKEKSEALKDALVELGLWLRSIKNGLSSVYTLTAAEYGSEQAIKELARDCGYRTISATYINEVLLPVFNGTADTDYPSINTGLIGGEAPVKYLKTIDFFTSNTSSHNHFISVQYDKNGSDSDIVTGVMQSILASVMAWMGPKKFTLDVVDFEYSGIGAYAAKFLPKRSVKIISGLADWEEELGYIEKLIENRSKKMQSIFQYNHLNPENTELFKIIVIQDYEGVLVKFEEKPKYETRESERQRTNAKRFLRFLEVGYKYGIIFLVRSQECIYNSSVPPITLGGISFFSTPFNRVFGIQSEVNVVPDSFVKWVAEEEESESGKNKAKAGKQQDGADGILTTEIADDGADVEFRMDTVSHTHAFVIGKTGSGKSVLLHNIITGLINSYGPDDLELYLLDLKMGGVEFNRYRRLPHLRSLLVDNSDIQIVLEIMRDIDVMMRERGKAFRNAGVSNIKEYNRANSDKKMPQVIVVIDECHAIFSMGGGRGAAKEQREITERLVKIAKEGRSQGIHLIFATQTLSGSEIPPDIQKNITDYYLLKCAPSDSESLVRGSSSKTEALPVGKVYYYHADRQALFLGVYNDNEACEELIAEALRRHSGKKSHGQFYFNGAQTFELSKEIATNLSANAGRAIAGSPGRMINLQQTPVAINLRRDYSENILITGINNEEQLSRTTLALMGSQILAAKSAGVNLKVNVINCLDPDSESSAMLRELADSSAISLYRPADSESLLKRLCENVSQKTLPTDTMLYIIGQERFGELKRDQKFAEETKDAMGAGDITDIFQGLSFTTSSSSDSTAYNSFKKAISYLLEYGPTEGLHTVIQIDKPDKLLYEEMLSSKSVSARFKHFVILRSDNRITSLIRLDDNVNVESLSADPERLRAYYYNDDDSTTRLFSPYDTITTQLLTEN